jgi:putative transposase
MKRARFTEEQIIAVLKEHEAGAKTADLARKHGISEATLYNWKAKFGGMDASEAKRLRQLEDENAKLKKLLAEQMLDAAALRGCAQPRCCIHGLNDCRRTLLPDGHGPRKARKLPPLTRLGPMETGEAGRRLARVDDKYSSPST